MRRISEKQEFNNHSYLIKKKNLPEKKPRTIKLSKNIKYSRSTVTISKADILRGCHVSAEIMLEFSPAVRARQHGASEELTSHAGKHGARQKRKKKKPKKKLCYC